MSHVKAMLDAYPKDLGNVDRTKLAECIEACFECARTCTACADACLSEEIVAELTKCIRPTSTALISAQPPVRCYPGTPATTRTSPRPCWRPAASPAQAAQPNVKVTQVCMSTAASAARRAADVNPPVPICSLLWDKEGQANGCPSARSTF
jgi:hypothetical protein